MKIGIVLLTIFCAFVSVNAQAAKTWQVNTNVTISSRFWDSLVIVGAFSFNGSMTNALAMRSNEYGNGNFCELIYPLDKLSSTNDDDSNQTAEGKCVDEEVLAKMDRVFWADPRNWVTSPENKATPHAERIPCNYDRLRIPNTTSTFIILPPKPVTLSSLRFGNAFLSMFSWKRYATNEYFMRHFLVKSATDLVDSFNFSLSGCEDRMGCTCGTYDYQDEICAFVEDSCAKDLPCEDPITPNGHCCKVCGATVRIWATKDKFVYKKLVPVVEKFIKSQSEELNIKVVWYMSKVTKREVQVVLLPEDEYTTEFLDLAEGLSWYLSKPSNLGISSTWTDHAGNPISKGRGWSATIKIFVGLAIVLIIGALYVYASKFKLLENLMPSFTGSKYEQHKEDGKNSFNNSKTTKNEVKAQDENTTETESTTQNEQTNLIDTSG
ncbi:protein amnionless isoform X2 [Planococcus citri]|uniref:protein amnionless isoform X2 n=1 Tax=Planococcus citri TaxID=170843 RepID=UPI0031FA01B1